MNKTHIFIIIRIDKILSAPSVDTIVRFEVLDDEIIDKRLN